MDTRRSSTIMLELNSSMEKNNSNKLSDYSDTRQRKTMDWSFNNEEILAEWGDTAQCYKWLHTRSFTKYSYIHACFTIPIIILSTSVGAISFLQINPGDNPRKYNISPYVTGGVNIFIGLLATIQEFLKVSEQQESHRIAYINWDKYARNIRIELAKIPGERMDAHSFIKTCRMNFDNLMETSPAIEASIVRDFISTFEGRIGTRKRKIFDTINKPDICKSIVSINQNRRKWFVENTTFSNPTYRRKSMKNNTLPTLNSVSPPLKRKRSIDNYRTAMNYSNMMDDITNNINGNIRLNEYITYDDYNENTKENSYEYGSDYLYSDENNEKNSIDPRYKIDTTVVTNSDEFQCENTGVDNDNIRIIFEINPSSHELLQPLSDDIPDVEYVSEKDECKDIDEIITGGTMNIEEANSSFKKQFGQGDSKNKDLF